MKKHSETREAVMNAAERLFAARGFRSTSLRAITAAAKANLGSVNYHFSTKDDLILAVLMRRMKPLNEQSGALLDRFEHEAGGGSVRVEKILEALFRPALELIARPTSGGRNFLRLLGFTLSEPGDYVRPMIEEQYAVKINRFHKALRRALPGLSKPEIFWRLHFSYGAFVHTISHPDILELSSRGLCRVVDTERTLGKIVAFCAAGFRARAAGN